MPWTPPTTYTDEVSTWGATDAMALGNSLATYTETVAAAINATIDAQVHLVPAPTGVAATDRAAINATIDTAATAGGGVVQLRAGTYRTDTAILLKSYVTLRGASKLGTTIKFADGVAGTINMIELSSARQEQASVENLMLDGNFVGQHGIYLFTDSLTNGAFASGQLNSRHRLSNLMIRYMGGDGVRFGGDGHNGECYVSAVQTYFCTGNGFYITDTSDTVFIGCDAGQSGLYGFRDIGNGNRFIGCKAWLSGRVDSATSGDGFRMSFSSMLSGCDAQDNGGHGYQLFNANGSMLSACRADTNGTRRVGGAMGVSMVGAINCRVDIVAYDRRGDSGIDPLVQQFAVEIGTGTGNVITGTAGTHAVGPLPTADYLTANNIQLQQTGSVFVARVPHSTMSHVDSISTAIGTTRRVETIDRAKGAVGAIALVNGQVQYVYFTAPATIAMTKLGFSTRGVAAVGATLFRLGLYTVAANGNLTLVARTANDVTIGAGTFTVYEKAMDATGGYVTSYFLSQGIRYAWAMIHVGTSTPAQVYGASIPGFAFPPILSHHQTGQTDLPTSVTFASLVASSSVIWATVGQ